MKLKRLEIQGFKSFPDRTVFKFSQDGMTAIVGPNGCGKSNIVDAVRWALGEQSAKLLRGQMMEDVIFNGSERRKPVGIAEVTLLFENDGTVEGPWRDYAEVAVSRRLYRTGESEYSINGVTCRLKDVRELLADAGGSSRGYSIVEQGRISLLINSRPEEKRALIEEAAGVLKYRMRRVEAERKLERTEQNLLRVNDVLREIKRQVDSLKRSAAKARRYRLLREELDGLVLRFRFEEHSRMDAEVKGLEAELASQQDALGRAETDLAGLEAREEELRVRLAGGEDGITAGFESVRAVESEMARLEGDISVREGAVRSLEERLGRLAEDTEELRRRGETQATERVQLELELKAIEGEHEENLRRHEAAKAAFTTAEEDLARAREEMERARKAVFDLAAEKHGLDAQIQAGERAAEGLSRREQDAQERRATLDARAFELQAAVLERRGRLQAAAARRDAAGSEVEEVRRALAAGNDELRAQEAGLARTAERMAELRGLHRTLYALEEEMEGYSDGVKNVLKDYAGTESSGVLGVVADYLEVPKPYEKAVVALLGERLGHVLVDRPENGQSAVDYLKVRARGRSSFIPRHLRANGKDAQSLKDVKGDGVLGPLSELVRFSGEVNGVGEYLVGGALLVEDLEKALSLWRRNGFTATMVTLDGDVVEASGVVTGGTLDTDETSPLARKRRLKEVKEASESAEGEMAQARGRCEELRRGNEGLEARSAALAAGLKEAEAAFLEEQASLAGIDSESSHLAGRLKDADAERALLSSERSDVTALLGSCRARLEQVRGGEQSARQSLSAAESAASQAALILEERRLDLEESRLRVSTVGLRKENSERALEAARSLTREMEERAQRIDAESTDARARIEGHRLQVASAQQSLVALAEDLDGRKAALLALRDDQDKRRAEAELVNSQVRETRAAASLQRQACAEQDIRIHELRTERQHVADRILEEHGVGIDQIDPARFEGGPLDREASQARINELRGRIGNLGEVNPGAVEQFEELNNRFTFMSAQKEDLEKSIESLREAIRKINRTSRERFLATFDVVRKNFSALIPRLFEGGSGEMVLLDENDPLNTGVEIHVRPPGKKLRSMQLMSGGEKALVSMTLILSLFLAKPSPFCILDEVDAPLDDENLGHFARIVKEMSSNIQFLVITHNKLTMETADALYGITMREPGVSQVVSVRLREVA